MTPHLLTRDELEDMPMSMYRLRCAMWQHIIRNLQTEHDRRYHAPKRAEELRRST
jgi:hypothetical protein